MTKWKQNIFLIIILYSLSGYAQEGVTFKTIYGYNIKGEYKKQKVKLDRRFCMVAFKRTVQEQKFMDSCYAQKGEIVFPDDCSPKFWCSIKVNSK